MLLRCPNTLWRHCTLFLCHWGRPLASGHPTGGSKDHSNSHRGSAGKSSPGEVFPFLFSLFFHFIYSPGRHRARILSFSRWLLWWSHCVHPHRWRRSESVSILQHYQAVCGENPSWKLFEATHLSLLQGDLSLLLTANKDSATSEHPVARPHLMRKGCWEITYSIFNHTLELLAKYTRTKI